MTNPVGRHRAETWVPERKVASGAVGGALAVVILWAVGLTGVEIPPEVASAITGLAVAGVAYLVPSPAAEVFDDEPGEHALPD